MTATKRSDGAVGPRKAKAAKTESDAVAAASASAPPNMEAAATKTEGAPAPESSVSEHLLLLPGPQPAAAAAAAPSAPAAPCAPPAEHAAPGAPPAELAPAATGATEVAGDGSEDEDVETEEEGAKAATETKTEEAKEARETRDAKKAEETKKAAAGAIPISFTALLEMDTAVDQSQYLRKWAAVTKSFVDSTLLAFLRKRSQKVGFTVPADVMLLAPLAISDASGCAQLNGFRDVLQYNNMMLALAKTGQYEAAGTVWMCEIITDSVVDTLSVSQVESALAAFSQAAFLRSSTHAPNRRFSFDVPLPVHMVDTSVAQKALRPAATGAETGVLMAEPLPLLAGGALVSVGTPKCSRRSCTPKRTK